MENKQLEEQLSMLISYFNACAGTRYRFGTESTKALLMKCIEVSDGNVREIRQFFKEFIRTNGTSIQDACNAYIDSKLLPNATQPIATPEPIAAAVTTTALEDAASANAALNLLGGMVVKVLGDLKADDIEAVVSKKLEDHAVRFIEATYGPIQKRVELNLGDHTVEVEGVVHAQFDNVLKFVKADEPVFLTGPAGSGKNVLCQQVAKALGLSFYFSNAVTQEYKITGFTDAMGIFHESQFYKAFKHGGLFMLDEMDASIPEVLVILNAAIANRYFDFPAPIGYVEAHKDFRVVAAGNTFGIGADYDYVGRNQLDAASLDRFAMVRVDYDPQIESAVSLGNHNLLDFCRKFRNATRKAGIRTVVSYRAISRMAKLDASMDEVSLLDSCLVKSLGAGDIDTILKDCGGCGEYSDALKRISDNRKAVTA